MKPESEKPDGYVAWHPEKGTWLSSADESEARVYALVSEREEFSINHPHFWTKRIAKRREVIRQAGWQIRPVRLQFLDTINKLEEKEKE